MKLKDVAFMVSLINANYRRRMLYYWINVLIIVGSALEYFRMPDQSYLIPLVMLLFGSLLRYVIIYLSLDGGNNHPWTIKKRQMTALSQLFDGKLKFVELRRCVPLHEYFEC